MTPGSPYSRPPLVEALLDIQVDLGEMPTESLLRCPNKVKKDYPGVKKAQQNTVEFSFGKKVSSSASSESTGYVFASPDKKQLFQAKRSGFTFNRLEPYLGWDAFIAEAKRLWPEYCKITKPPTWNRLALRYINRFDIPLPVINLETYFRTYPEVSRDLPQFMQGFFFQFNLPIEEIGSMATITQTGVSEPTKPDCTSIILDIDLYRIESLPAENEPWPLFETLRIWKNKIFESCITDKARELIY